MALTAWNGRAAGQTDADSPVDQTLMDSIRLDLDHLREVLYGNGAGGFLVPIEGHNHNTVNSVAVVLGANSVGESQIQANSVTQSELKTTTGEFSGAVPGLGNQRVQANTWGHFPIVGGSNDAANVSWGLEDGTIETNIKNTGQRVNFKAYNRNAVAKTGHITWISHAA